MRKRIVSVVALLLVIFLLPVQAFGIETAYLITGVNGDTTTGQNVTGYYVDTPGMKVFVETDKSGNPTGYAYLPQQKVGDITTTDTKITPLPMQLNNKNIRELKPLEMRIFYPNCPEFTLRNNSAYTLQWYFWDSDPKNWILVGEARNPNEFAVEATVNFTVELNQITGGSGQYGYETGRRYSPAGWDVTQDWGSGYGSTQYLQVPAGSNTLVFQPGETKWFLLHGADSGRWALGTQKDYILASYVCDIKKVINTNTDFFYPWDMNRNYTEHGMPAPYLPNGEMINRIILGECYGGVYLPKSNDDTFSGLGGTAIYDWEKGEWHVNMAPDTSGLWCPTQEQINELYNSPKILNANKRIKRLLDSWGLNTQYFYDPRRGLVDYTIPDPDYGSYNLAFRVILPSSQYNQELHTTAPGWRHGLWCSGYAINMYGFAMYDWKKINPDTPPNGSPPATKYDFVITNPDTKEGYLVAK